MDQFDVRTMKGIVVTCPGATHYKVGDAMLESGMLIDKGFDTLGVNTNTAILMPKPGVDEIKVVERMMAEVEKLIASGEVRVS